LQRFPRPVGNPYIDVVVSRKRVGEKKKNAFPLKGRGKRRNGLFGDRGVDCGRLNRAQEKKQTTEWGERKASRATSTQLVNSRKG